MGGLPVVVSCELLCSVVVDERPHRDVPRRRHSAFVFKDGTGPPIDLTVPILMYFG